MNIQFEIYLNSANRLSDGVLFVSMNKKTIKKVCIWVIILFSSFSLSAQDHYYMKGDTVFYSFYKINEIDTKTFKPINTNYGMDCQRVYYKNKQIKYADVASFKVLNNYYSCDEHHVFYKEEIIAGADVASFKILDTDYASDKSSIYFWGEKLESCDVKTFRPMKIAEEYYSYDHKRIYWRHKKLKDIDIKTFHVRERYNSFAFDKKRVYHFGKLVKGADAKTFEILSDYYYRDKRRVYSILMDVIEEADAKTFQVYCPSSPYGRDKNWVFYKNKLVFCPNPDDFVVIGYNMAHDGHYLYFEELVQDTISSEHLKMKPCNF